MFDELILALLIVAVCVVIHVSGLVLLSDQVRIRLRPHDIASLFRDIGLLIAVFGVVLMLHMAEAGIWALFYQGWQLFPNFETSLYFSLTSYTTIGFGDVVLPDKWRLLGGIEGFSGLLLTGLSTAFLYVLVTTVLQNRRKEIEPALDG